MTNTDSLKKQKQSFETWLATSSQRFNQLLLSYLENLPTPSQPLAEAMAYACLNGGKRIRPLLVYATGSLFDTPLEKCDPAALSLELIHAYSLVHDDLPAMDNAETRRGKASCFKAFGEDLAILAGDALQTLAFESLSHFPAPLSAEQRLGMVQILSKASGLRGMAGGQALDILNNQAEAPSEAALCQLYRLKTGALIEASVAMALQASTLRDLKEESALLRFAENISLAFQIQDDLLDIEGDEADLGKPAGRDLSLQKRTYPALFGLAQAKEKAASLFQSAFEALEIFGPRAELLRQLSESIRNRKK